MGLFMVYSGLYPTDGDEYPFFRDALGKSANDASFVFEPESSGISFGFRCDFRPTAWTLFKKGLKENMISSRLPRSAVKHTVETLSGLKWK